MSKNAVDRPFALHFMPLFVIDMYYFVVLYHCVEYDIVESNIIDKLRSAHILGGTTLLQRVTLLRFRPS